ncbi:MAG TPA: hypothetical protein VNO30_02745 [Kofleriaceae bacterium]|nr:hypothetical protein [Kofleriaceae bacterium]
MPPEPVPLADARAWSLLVDAEAMNLLSTHDRYHAAPPEPKEVREANAAAPPGSKVILPRMTAVPALSVEAAIPKTATTGKDAVVKNTFQSKPPATGTREQVEAALQSALTYDKTSNGFAALPIPFGDLDTIRCFFADRTNPGFNTTWGLDDDGPIEPDGTLNAQLPELLLATTDQNVPTIGELDRMVLRSPICGRFRFEPYFLYRNEGGTVRVVGPSNTGRVTMQQPTLSIREGAEGTGSQVFKQRILAFEHVDRRSVARVIDLHLALHLQWVEQIVAHFGGAKTDHPRLVIPKSSKEVRDFVLSEVNNLLRAWIAFLFSIRWRAEDTAAAGTISTGWAGKLPTRDAGAADAVGIVEVAKGVLAAPAMLESLRYFSSTIYAPRLAGFTWSEVLRDARQDPETLRFPAPGDIPPYAPADEARKKQYNLLRLVDDPAFRWIACYAGSPVGKPARVYAPAAAVGTAFPHGGLTTYEVEALHVAGSSGAALGLSAQPAGAGPRPGYAMDLTPYDAKATGNACWISAQRTNRFHTLIDFLVELTEGIHFSSREQPFVDIHALLDPATGRGHPLRVPLHSDDWLRAVFLRSQMDTLAATNLGNDSIKWWAGKVDIPASDLAPKNPYRSETTFIPGAYRATNLKGQVGFRELYPPPIGTGQISGFNLFDLTSAMLASQRITHNGSRPLPLPVLLALMDKEGVRAFGAINRIVRNTTNPAETLRWEALWRNPPPDNIRFTRAYYPVGDDAMARRSWLSYPYGLDTFAQRDADDELKKHLGWVENAGVLSLEPQEDPGRYLRERVLATWHAMTPAFGFPVIWKRSRRAHWVCLSLMTAWFRMLESDMHAAAAGAPRPYHRKGEAYPAGKPSASWLPAGSSPPSLERDDGSRVGPNDTEWKDFLTYYGMLYIAYNANPRRLTNEMDAVDAALPSSWVHTKRDYLVFRHSRGEDVINRMVNFVIAIDAYLRLHYMGGLAPQDYPAALPLDTAPLDARWGIPKP